jgi:hypothetical protein
LAFVKTHHVGCLVVGYWQQLLKSCGCPVSFVVVVDACLLRVARSEKKRFFVVIFHGRNPIHHRLVNGKEGEGENFLVTCDGSVTVRCHVSSFCRVIGLWSSSKSKQSNSR